MLGVPASFDEVARELTVRAARQAGLVRLVLLEEPQAAFYAWIHGRGTQWGTQVRAGQTILVCDVGGGTSDFTLIRVRPAAADGRKVMFHRVAVGEHLILGGDNLDLALAHHVEQKLEAGGRKLDPRQFGPLVRACRAAKETLLGPDAPDRLTVTVAGGGSRLIGGATQVELTRDDAHRVLVDGFLPRVALSDKPAARRSGFQEFGLPYAPDAAITRYLAAFLSAHRATARTGDEPSSADHDPARPDLVLFNGGLFESPVLRERLVDVLRSWFANAAAVPAADVSTFPSDAPEVRSPPHPNPLPEGEGEPLPPTNRGWSPTLLKSDRLDLAVARGAAYYGMVRRGKGVRISGGLAHSYYLGVETADPAAPPSAVCLLPAGVEEGQTVDLPGRTFNLLIRQPAEFPLYYSATRTTDPPGHLLAVDAEQLTALPPIRTVLQSGRGRGDADTVPVALHARLTEVGTLDIWCGEVRGTGAVGGGGDRQWRLQFDVRAASRADVEAHQATDAAEGEGVVDEAVVEACRAVVRGAFIKTASGVTDSAASVVKRLEQASGIGRNDWPASLMRSFWETLIEVEPAGRGLSVEHEARWLNLAGFCLRPGYGLAVDDWRVARTWRLAAAEVTHHKNELVRAEWWVLWRRLAGGLSPGQQTLLADPLLAAWRTYLRKLGAAGGKIRWQAKTFQFGPHESAEAWRALGSMELLKPDAKRELGGLAFDLLVREKSAAVRDALWFAVGRIGARVPVYGPLNALVPASLAGEWAGRVMSHPRAPGDDKAAFAVVQLCRRTEDRYRDVPDDVRAAAIDWLAARNAPPHLVELVRVGGQLQAEEQRVVFGESLPRGLRIE